MKVEITAKRYNPLLKRTEITFKVDHRDVGGTPRRIDVRRQIASMLNVDLDLVYIRRIVTKTGTMIAVGEANVYDMAEQAKFIEPDYIIARNAPPKEEKEGEEAG